MGMECEVRGGDKSEYLKGEEKGGERGKLVDFLVIIFLLFSFQLSPLGIIRR